MENGLSQYANYFTALKDWVFALSVIPATWILRSYLKAILLSPQKKAPAGWLQKLKEGPYLGQLWPSIASVIYIGSLTCFVELAPISGRAYSGLAGINFILCVVLGLTLTQRTVLLGFQWASQRAKYEEIFDVGFFPLLKNVITIFVGLTGGIIILKHFNYDVMSLITALGVSSLAVGLAAKDTLSNMISGFILIIDRNLKPGDRVNLNGNVGDVIQIGLRSTLIRVNDGNTLIVPNSDLVNNRILNLSLHSREIQVPLHIRIPYDAAFFRVREICLQISNQIEGISKSKPTRVNLTTLSEGHQLIAISLWVLNYSESGAVTSEFNERLLTALDKEKILLSQPIKCHSCQPFL
jgi:small-conductance mechanosensitive channel